MVSVHDLIWESLLHHLFGSCSSDSQLHHSEAAIGFENHMFAKDEEGKGPRTNHIRSDGAGVLLEGYLAQTSKMGVLFGQSEVRV